MILSFRRAANLGLAIFAFTAFSFLIASHGWASCGDYLLHVDGQELDWTSPERQVDVDGVKRLAALRFPWQQELPCDSPGCRQSRSPQSHLFTLPMPPRHVPMALDITNAVVFFPLPLFSRQSSCCDASPEWVTQSGLIRPPQSV